jgi:hypothetical protein
MTFAQPTVSPLRQRMIDNMRMRRLSPKTQASYLRIVREFARYRHRRGPANLPAASGRSWHVAGVTERRDYRLEVLLRDHAPRSRADDPDAARARAPYATGRAQLRRSAAAHRRNRQPQAPGGPLGCLRHRVTRQRSGGAEGRPHRQSAHDAAHRAGQGTQGPLAEIDLAI